MKGTHGVGEQGMSAWGTTGTWETVCLPRGNTASGIVPEVIPKYAKRAHGVIVPRSTDDNGELVPPGIQSREGELVLRSK